MNVLFQLAFEFFKTGIFTVGGGLASLPFLYDISDRMGWYTHAELIDMIAIAESTPGPIGANMATFAGYKAGGMLGSVIASIALIVGPMILVLIIANFLEKFKENKHVQAVFYGLRPAVAGLITAACYGVMAISLFSPDALATGDILGFFNIKACALFAVMLWAVMKFKKHPVVYIAICAVLGIIIPF